MSLIWCLRVFVVQSSGISNWPHEFYTVAVASLCVGTNQSHRCLTVSLLPSSQLITRKGRSVMVIFLAVYNSVCLIAWLQETQTDFNDLGKLLLGGVVAAIVFAVAFTFVRLRLREKNPEPSSNFISISAPREEKENG